MDDNYDRPVGTYGSYGSGIGTYVYLITAAAVVTLIMRWVF